MYQTNTYKENYKLKMLVKERQVLITLSMSKVTIPKKFFCYIFYFDRIYKSNSRLSINQQKSELKEPTFDTPKGKSHTINWTTDLKQLTVGLKHTTISACTNH